MTKGILLVIFKIVYSRQSGPKVSKKKLGILTIFTFPVVD